MGLGAGLGGRDRERVAASGRAGGGALLYSWARTLVRGAQERRKPSADRLAEFSDSRLRAVESGLFAERPVYPSLNVVQIEWWLAKTREWLTVDSPYARTLLGKESPEALSAHLIEGTRLADPAVRALRARVQVVADPADQLPTIASAGAPADAPALQQDHRQAALGQFDGGIQAGEATADDADIRLLLALQDGIGGVGVA